jgi:hypothetical protein
MKTWPNLFFILCWFHLLAALKKHATQKLNIDTDYLDNTILPIVRSLHRAPSNVAFDALLAAARRQFMADNKVEFVEYFESTYTVDRWRKWFVGAMPIVGVGFTNNPTEAMNRQIKIVVS